MSLPDFYVTFEMSIWIFMSLSNVTTPENGSLGRRKIFQGLFRIKIFTGNLQPAASTPPSLRETAYALTPAPSLLPQTPFLPPAPSPATPTPFPATPAPFLPLAPSPATLTPSPATPAQIQPFSHSIFVVHLRPP
ncbi:unnamed protein product [Cuscuta epithymum]|uniref:Uncharacterized protein n=1 Tax=Cuscuta epithymum TaxID=186058 RepID=A0AAV0CXX1_9ASTE|nr:unnamed protein product [Cuscuta epithymum]